MATAPDLGRVVAPLSHTLCAVTAARALCALWKFLTISYNNVSNETLEDLVPQYYIIQHISCCALPARKQREFQSQTIVISISQVPKGFLVAQSVKNQPVMQETACYAGDPDSIPGSGKSPGEGNGNPLQYPCLGNPMDRGAWWAIVHGVARVVHDLATKLLPLLQVPKNI